MDKISKIVLEDWTFKFNNESLKEDDIIGIWDNWVPKTFERPVTQKRNILVRDEILNDILLRTLDKFIMEGNYFFLERFDNTKNECCETSHVGISAYTCKDCAIDESCVLCVECFSKSAHNKHERKIVNAVSTIENEEFCNCGDEVWRTDQYCKTHLPSIEKNPHTPSADLVERIQIVLRAVLMYSCKWSASDNMLERPHSEFMEDSYALLNCSKDTYEKPYSIGSTFGKLISSNRDLTRLFEINVIKYSSFDDCKMASLVGILRNAETAVIHTSIIAHQLFVLHLFGWLLKYIKVSKYFRRIFTCVVLNISDGHKPLDFHSTTQPTPFMKMFLLQVPHLWDKSWWHCLKICFKAFFMEYENKLDFTNFYMCHYDTFILKKCDDFLHYKNFSTQIFRDRNLCQHLFENDALYKIIYTLKYFTIQSYTNCGNFIRWLGATNQILCDVKKLLVFVRIHSTEESNKRLIESVKLFIDFLAVRPVIIEEGVKTIDIEDSNIIQKEFKKSDIEIPFILFSLANMCSMDQNLLIEVYKLTYEKLSEFFGFETKRSKVESEVVEDVYSGNPTHELIRFWAFLHLKLDKFRMTFDSIIFNSEQKVSPKLLMQHALISFDNPLRVDVFKIDIVILQICATLMPPDEFISCLLEHFKLINSSNKFESVYKVTEEFLLLFVRIITERFVPSVGQVTNEECLKKEISEVLFVKPTNLFGIKLSLYSQERNIDKEIDRIIHIVARPISKRSDKYILKRNFSDNRNPFSCNNDDEIKKIKREPENLIAGNALSPLPPKLPSFTTAFKNVLNILDYELIIKIISELLQDTLSNKQAFSQLQIGAIFHLIFHALNEETEWVKGFLFTAKKYHIFKCLRPLCDFVEGRAFTWIVQSITKKCPEMLVDEIDDEKELLGLDRKKIKAGLDEIHRNFFKKSDKGLLGVSKSKVSEKCSICQISQSPDVNESLEFVLPAFLQMSSVMVRQRDKNVYKQSIVLDANLGPAAHISCCGHAVHNSCSEQLPRDNIECTICKKLFNIFIPLMPKNLIDQSQILCNDLSFSQWFSRLLLFILFPNKNNFLSGDADPVENLHGFKLKNDNVPRLKPKIDCKTALNRVVEMINQFIEKFSEKYLRKGSYIPTTNEKFFFFWKTISYTIHSIECRLDRDDKSLLGDFKHGEKKCLENIIRTARVSARESKDKVRPACLVLLKELFYNMKVSIYDMDSFGVVVALQISMIPTYNLSYFYVRGVRSVIDYCYRIGLLISIAQIMISTDEENSELFPQCNVSDAETDCLSKLIKIFKSDRGINTIKLWKVIKLKSIPFLRRSAIFNHFFTDRATPESLKMCDGDTYETLTKYLGIPSTCEQLLSDNCVFDLFFEWSKHPKTKEPVIVDMSKKPALVPLPRLYQQLVSRCKNIPRPILCMICGKAFSAQEQFDDSYDEDDGISDPIDENTTSHVMNCGRDMGIFINVHKALCTIFIIGLNYNLELPYWNKYGKINQNMTTGEPLYLDKDKYIHLQNRWLNHDFNIITDEIDSNPDQTNF